MYVVLTSLLLLCLGLELPSLSWLDRLKLAGLAATSLATSTLNILALKVEEAGRVALVDRCSAVVIAFLSQVLCPLQPPPAPPQTLLYGNIPDPLTWAGLALVLTAMVATGARKLVAARYLIPCPHQAFIQGGRETGSARAWSSR